MTTETCDTVSTSIKSHLRRNAVLRFLGKFCLSPRVILGVAFGTALLYCLLKQFYFYQAVVAAILIVPLVIPFLQYAPRQSLLALLVLSIPFNPSFHIIRYEMSQYYIAVTLNMFASDLILAGIYAYLLVANVLKVGQRKLLNEMTWTSALPLLLWFTAAALSIFPAINKTVAMIELARMMRACAIFVAVYNVVQTPNDIRLIIYCMLVAFAVQTGLVLLEYGIGHPLLRLPGGSRDIDIAGTILRPSGTMGHSSHFAKLSAVVLPLCLATATCARKKALQLCASILLVTGLLALATTTSRVGIATSMFGLVWVLFLLLKRRGLTVTSATAAFVFITVGIGFGWFVAGDNIMSRIKHDEDSAALRPKMFSVAVNVIKDHPFLGVGLNNYTIVASRYRGVKGDNPWITEVPVHNIYLLLCSEIGVFGVAFFLWFLIRSLLHAFSYTFKAGSNFDSAIAVSVGVGLSSSWLQGLVDWGFRESIVHTSYLAILAGAFTVMKYQAQQR